MIVFDTAEHLATPAPCRLPIRPFRTRLLPNRNRVHESGAGNWNRPVSPRLGLRGTEGATLHDEHTCNPAPSVPFPYSHFAGGQIFYLKFLKIHQFARLYSTKEEVIEMDHKCGGCNGNGRCSHCHGSGKWAYPGYGTPSDLSCSWCQVPAYARYVAGEELTVLRDRWKKKERRANGGHRESCRADQMREMENGRAKFDLQSVRTAVCNFVAGEFGAISIRGRRIVARVCRRKRDIPESRYPACVRGVPGARAGNQFVSVRDSVKI